MRKDKVANIAQMVTRLGFVIAIVLGLGIWFNFFSRTSVLHAHMGGGVLVLLGTWISAIRFTTLGRSGTALLWAAALLAVVGILFAFGVIPGGGVVHFLAMLVAVGLSEMSVARINRAAR